MLRALAWRTAALLLLLSPLSRGESISRKIIISDLHLGAGTPLAGKPNHLEDFRFDSQFRTFLETFRDKPTELVIAGDFIDFWQILPERNVKNDSIEKVRVAINGHRGVFKVLGEFVSYFPQNRIVVVPGNHDVDLTWPGVQKELRQATTIEDPRKLLFVSGGYRDHDIWVEHGHQYDELNRFENVDHPWKTLQNGQRLEVNWGTEFVQKVFNKVEEKLEFIDNLVPTTDVIWLALRREPSLARDMPNLWRFIAHAKRSQQALLALGREVYQGGEPAEMMADDPKLIFNTFSGSPDQFVSGIQKLYDEDENFRAKLSEQFRLLSEEERRALAIPVVFGEKQTTTLGVVGTDPYVEAAERIRTKEGVKVVVFGHTHEARTYPPDSSMPFYLNTGCWIQTLSVTEAKRHDWSSLKLDDRTVFPLRFSWVSVNYGNRREPVAKLNVWSGN